MMASERVLVVGGTRGTGLLIARLLLERGDLVRVLARDPARAAERLAGGAEVVAGDITKPETLPAALQGSDHIVFTAGVHSARVARERLVRRTDYQGVLNTIEAARASSFAGRFLYMNSIGVNTPSLSASILNLLKRNTLVWRRRAEDDIRASGLNYSIIRVGFLQNRPGGQCAVEIGQDALPLAPRFRIARADVADVFVAALRHPRASHATFEIVSGKGRRREDWNTLLGRLKADAAARPKAPQELR
jgi:uncharacterized protein YbjT (DUF2867 family)